MSEIEKAIKYIEQHGTIADSVKDLAIQALQEKLERENHGEGWIPFELECDEEEKVEMLSCKLPDDEEEIIVTDGRNVWKYTFLIDVDECYLDGGNALITEVTHWMPLLEPPKE